MSEVVQFKRPDPSPDNLGELIELYLTTRDAKQALERKQREHLKKYNATMKKIEGKLMSMLQERGLQSLSSDIGTAYLSTKRSAPISDSEAFRNYVIENRAWDMVDWHANVVAVSDFIAEHEVLPPGVEFKSIVSLGVMRK
jgi:hypothetical protein